MQINSLRNEYHSMYMNSPDFATHNISIN